MVRGGRSGRGSISSGAPSTSVGRGVRLPDYTGCPNDRVRLPDYASCPGDGVRITPSSVTYPISFSSWYMQVESHNPAAEEVAKPAGCQPCWIFEGKIDIGSASRYITSLFDMFTRRYMFTRPEDLPRARAVWESTAQTNFIKSMWEAPDKAMKITSGQDPTDWMDYGPVWMRMDYWGSHCHRWATRPWQERSQEAKRNRAAHPEKNVHTSGSVFYAAHSQKLRHELKCAPTFRELFDRTHKRKGTDDYVTESGPTFVTYGRTMVDRYAEGTPQPDLDPEAWVDAVGGPRKG
ncbi:hypothetical protein Taro_054395 [Colocasia esculenta]|uniref:Uncharacterized protein n=1 Tax=Colocasia esculenta TaxID=4460 RepID=A0A843XQZ3_COLES|nr:hypothetical protein [Colocasia esculenta]